MEKLKKGQSVAVLNVNEDSKERKFSTGYIIYIDRDNILVGFKQERNSEWYAHKNVMTEKAVNLLYGKC